jgi:mRNA-degrading endonuclease RelE of RelBE toxin-antitoxin system
MPFAIEITDFALTELEAIKVHYRRQIIDAINQQLMHEPTVETRNRKKLDGVQPSFEHTPPIWELRVGEYRVYYDLRSEDTVVYVRSIRHKRPHASTEQMI